MGDDVGMAVVDIVGTTRSSSVTERHAPDSAVALAGIRIAVAGTALLVLSRMRPWEFAELGLSRERLAGGWALDLLPESSWALNAGSAAFALALVALAVGWHARVAAWICFVLGFWILGTPQGLAGTIHVHHMLPLFAVLGATACDARWAVRPVTDDARSVDAGTVAARLVVGTVYFFPGLMKLLEADSWLSPGHLKGHVELHHRLYDPALEAMPPNWMFAVMAVATLVMELGFIFLVFTRFRVPVVLLAFTFHVGTAVTMDLWFISLMWLVPVFLLPQPNWAALPLHGRGLAVAAGLTLGLGIAGAFGTTAAWPVASYPKFTHPASESTAELHGFAVSDDGQRYRIGEVLLPGRTAGTWAKVERRQPEHVLASAVERRVGQNVTIEWVEAPS